jgi:hypothetical protein
MPMLKPWLNKFAPVQPCFPCIGEQFERAPLFCAELTFLMQNAHRILLRREAASVPGMILVSPIVRTNPDMTEAFASR